MGRDGAGRIVVIGAGQNGLAAAARLAASGRAVTVLEARDRVGGLCGAEEFHPGYFAPGILHDEGLVSPAIAARLGLERHGLSFRAAPPVLLAGTDGRGILLAREAAATGGELPSREAEAYARYRSFFARVAPLLQAVMSSPPPSLAVAGGRAGIGEVLEVVRRGFTLLRLGRKQTIELLRVAPMCVADFLNERFSTPLLVEGLAAPAVAATWSGPWSAGTTTNLLLQECAPGRFVDGGPPALIAALERAARAASAEIRTAAPVERLRVESGAVTGVVLGSGETLDAAAVVATCDPKRAMLRLVPPGALPIAVEQEFERVRARGTAAKLHLALSAPLAIAGRDGRPIEALRLGGGHVDDLERAFDAVKYRAASPQPYLDVRVGAAAGHHVLSILASYAPYEVEAGWNDAQRAGFTQAVLARLEPVDAAIRTKIVAAELLTPADLEARYGTTGGQLHHVEPALDQLVVMRPTASTARYATPLRGLYLGGSGSHGGGGVTCTAGVLAAETLLARRGRRVNQD